MEALEFLQQKYDFYDCDDNGCFLVHPGMLVMWLNEFHLIQEEANSDYSNNKPFVIPDVMPSVCVWCKKLPRYKNIAICKDCFDAYDK